MITASRSDMASARWVKFSAHPIPRAHRPHTNSAETGRKFCTLFPALLRSCGTGRGLRLLGFRVGIDHIAGFIFVWPYNNFMGRVLELIDRIAGDVLELGEKHTGLRPFAVLAERDVTDHGMEGVAMHISRERGLVGAFCAFHRLLQRLPGRIGEWRKGPSHRIDPLGFS